MEKRQKSPPKHRHDGTSPLPLGMDWSPPPKIWAERETVWPHDHRTGWSYCVTIPSWVVLPKSRDSDPIVFYRVLVGIQSPEGVTTSRAILRRFNDFLKFMAALKKAFPRKNLPPAPPKGFLQLKTRALLEERRRSLEDWMGKLLSDIDVSRSVPVASFLELEAAARTSFQDENQHSSEPNSLVDGTVSSLQVQQNLSLFKAGGSSSLTSEYGSDTAYQTSEIGTPSLGRDNNSEAGTEDLSLDVDLTSPIDRFMKYGMSNIDEGLFMGQAILEQLENFPRYKMNARENIKVMENNVSNGNTSNASYLTENMTELLSRSEHGKMIRHARKLSAESIGSDMSSQRGSEASTSALPNSLGDGSIHLPQGADVSGNIDFIGNTDIRLQNDVQLLLPIDQRQKLNGVLLTMQRRLVTAKNDMEDLISRLYQEIAVKDYLTTKVKDLEVELETTKQKAKENLEQAVLLERARITQMQWDMEELRRKSMEMELRLNSQEDQKRNTGSTKVSVNEENDELLQELIATRKELEDLLKRHQESEVKSKADIKVLVKEVKSLRSSQAELKQKFHQSLQEKSEIQGLLQQEKLNSEQTRTSWRKWLSGCEDLLNQLHECKVNLLNENGENVVTDIPSLSDALDLLATSDNKIDVLLDKAERLQQEIVHSVASSDNINKLDDDTRNTDEELRKMLRDMIFGNAELRKQVNSLIRHAIKMKMSSGNDACDAPSIEEDSAKH